MANICTSEIVVEVNEKTRKIIEELLDVNPSECTLMSFFNIMKKHGVEINEKEMSLAENSRDVNLIPWYDDAFISEDDPSEVYIGGESKWNFPCEFCAMISEKLDNTISFMAYEPGDRYCYVYGKKFVHYSYIVDCYSIYELKDGKMSIPQYVNKLTESFQGYYLVENKTDLLNFISELFDISMRELINHSDDMTNLTEYIINTKPRLVDNYPISICEITHYDVIYQYARSLTKI